MNKIYSIIFCLLFYSCSALPRATHHKKGIDPVFKPYIESYKTIIGKSKYEYKFKKLSMNFKKLENDVIRKCWWLLDGGYEIEVDPDWWYGNIFDPEAQEFLAYHELEHCIRYRLHSNKKDEIENISDFFEEIGYYLGILSKPGYLSDGCPASLMHSHVMSYRCRKKHYIYYIKELQKWEN